MTTPQMQHTKALVDGMVDLLTELSAKIEREEVTPVQMYDALENAMNLMRGALIGGHQMAEGKRS
jgi:hypothetical protein